ncbi:MAG: hypothetical protein EA393_09885 [Bacteroidetes bacterium]|nr:MAG: hypothetical protein EA393_09885 [Bacteroidota bacterium]
MPVGLVTLSIPIPRRGAVFHSFTRYSLPIIRYQQPDYQPQMFINIDFSLITFWEVLGEVVSVWGVNELIPIKRTNMFFKNHKSGLYLLI